MCPDPRAEELGPVPLYLRGGLSAEHWEESTGGQGADPGGGGALITSTI